MSLTLKGLPRALLQGLGDLLYPRTCLVCNGPVGGELSHLCAFCREGVSMVQAPWCSRCGTPMGGEVKRCDSCRDRSLFFRWARGAALNEGPVKALVGALKFSGVPSAARPLAGFVADLLNGLPTSQRPDVLVPVPMHWYRRLRRGYNQALLIAEGAGRAVGIPTVDVLRRVRSSPTQVGLSREERWVNPAETMMVRRAGPVVGRRVAVVDDVLTTCATASECARVLREAGAQDVVVVAAVRQR